MNVVFESSRQRAPLDDRIAAEGTVHLDSGGTERVERALADLRDTPPDGPLRMTLTRDRLAFEGSIRSMRAFDRRDGEEQPLFPQTARAECAVRIDPCRYELAVAINDHLLGAASNHEDAIALRVATRYDDDGEQLTIALAGSLGAISYLALLIEIHVTQSRFA